mgnify:CR=1 FL=1
MNLDQLVGRPAQHRRLIGRVGQDEEVDRPGPDADADAFGLEEESVFEKLTRREYALIACATGALVLALLPLLLHFFGTRWRPGTQPRIARPVSVPGANAGSTPSMSNVMYAGPVATRRISATTHGMPRSFT